MTVTQTSKKHSLSLYERDYYLWLKATVQQLKARRFSELDIPKLIEEVEDMGRSEKRAIESNWVVILMHLLKYKYQPDQRSNRWLANLFEHRRRFNRAFKDSPSLRPYFTEVFGECYQDARKEAALETGLSLATFPIDSPFMPEESLDSDFLPVEQSDFESSDLT